MPGLVPGIHAEPAAPSLKDSRSGAAWMAGTSPAMTSNSCIYRESSRTASGLPFSRTAVPRAGEGVMRSMTDEGKSGDEEPDIELIYNANPVPHPALANARATFSRKRAGLSGRRDFGVGESIGRRCMLLKTNDFRLRHGRFRLFSGCRISEKDGIWSMRFSPSIFAQTLAPINRRQFDTIVARHDGDAGVKTFTSWDHLVLLIFAQFSAADGLRGLEASWNANRQHHYHLGTGEMARSTLSDASKVRPVALFAETFSLVAGLLDRQTRHDGTEMLRLIDSTPIPLGKLCQWAKSNGRIRGMKIHVLYDPKSDCPRILDITDANINDAEIGRTIIIEAGASYVFDKGYCHYGWWGAIHDNSAFFVTRPKSNMGLTLVAKRPLEVTEGDYFTILEDAEVRFSSKGDSKLPMKLRRITVKRHANDAAIELLTNDMKRSAVAIAALYKGRWQIELLFRWMKQHLGIRKFLGNNDNAIRLQLIAAMIAYALVRIAAKVHRVAIPILRFLNLVAQCIFDRRDIAAIDKPPPVNPSKKRDRTSPDQYRLCYE
jgi:putative transposase